MFGCFIGVIILALSKQEGKDLESSSENENKVSTSHYALGLVCMLVTAWAYACGCVVIHRLRDVHFSIIRVYYGLFAILLLLIWTTVEKFYKQEDL